MFYIFYPTASATAYGQRLKFVRAKHSAMAEGENCAYGPTLLAWSGCFSTTTWSVFGARHIYDFECWTPVLPC